MAADPTSVLADRIAAEIERSGPMRFSRYVDLALYAPGLGFYERGGAAGGRRGDFITSVETGPLFAAVVGKWLDRAWAELGRPDPFAVAEAAAGVGTLWRGLRRASPACFDALSWLLVERSERLRAEHADLPAGRWQTHVDLPLDRVHLVVANELLDNLAFDIAERIDGAWREVLVDRVDDGFGFAVGDRIVTELAELDAPTGTRVPVAVDAVDWIDRARRVADRVLVLDYGAPTVALAERGIQTWLRTYAGHGRAGDPLGAPGTADITHDVPFDQLPSPRRHDPQADWLRRHGLDELVEQARRRWDDRAAVGDLEAMFARSAITEAAALVDPSGLGGFSVLEW